MSSIDFRALFDSLTSPYMVLDTELRYVAVNPAYEQAVMRSRQELIGRYIFDLFPNSGESGQRLLDSFRTVIQTGQPDTLAFLPYDIPRSDDLGGGAEQRFWSAVHTPLFGADGKVAFVVQNTVDVTELQRLKDAIHARPQEMALLQRTQEVEKAHQSLIQESAQFRELFMQAPGFIAILTEPEHIFAFVNNAYQQLIGHRDVIGRPVREVLPEITDQGFFELLDQVFSSGQAFVGSGIRVVLQRSPGGTPESRYVDFVYQPIRDAAGQVSGIFVEGSDVTDRIRAIKQQRLLLDELNHRVKNTLANVQSISAQTLRTTPDPAAFREAFEARLMALSATHDLLTATTWSGADLTDVLLIELKPHGTGRYKLHGPPVMLASQEALTFGLVFHELATNAAKYGALSTSEGCVGVSWTVDEGRLKLEWREENGPPVKTPKRTGFGSRLIERSVKSDLGGQAALDFRPEGLVCRIDIKLAGPRL